MTQQSKPPLTGLAKLLSLVILILLSWLIVGVIVLIGVNIWSAVLR